MRILAKKYLRGSIFRRIKYKKLLIHFWVIDFLCILKSCDLDGYFASLVNSANCFSLHCVNLAMTTLCAKSHKSIFAKSPTFPLGYYSTFFPTLACIFAESLLIPVVLFQSLGEAFLSFFYHLLLFLWHLKAYLLKTDFRP